MTLIEQQRLIRRASQDHCNALRNGGRCQRWPASSIQRLGSAKWILCRLGSFWAVAGASRREGFSPTEVGPGNGGENSCCRSLRQMVIVKTLWRPCVKT